jgi:signal transduction histidine kinase
MKKILLIVSIMGILLNANAKEVTDEKMLNIASKLIKSQKFSCNKIDRMIHLPMSSGYKVTCDSKNYSFLINEKDGKWIVVLE